MYKQTDQLGNVTRYNYDQLAGRLYSVTDAKGNTTKYTYNNDTNQLLSVSSGGMTNYYAYENDRLTFINSNNSVGYKFTYDNFGRTLKNEVGNGTEFRTLSTMYYDKHLLIGQAYGNGDYINYSYDNLDRLTEIKYNDNENKKKTYIYGTDGNVSSVLDTASNTRTKYVYDLSGRLVETKEYSGTNLSGNQIISNTEYFYQDKTNYLTWMNHNSTLGNLAVAFDYGILANGQMPDQVYNVWWNGTTHLSRSFDGLGRLSSSVINNTLTTNYYYKDISDTQTTTQLQSMVTPAGTFTYTYDSLGNITSIVTANSEGTFTSTYEYDALNQLVRENDQKNNVTYTYEYLNGNILSKKQYAYTTGELGAVVNTINYGYGDSVWKDLLTSYNGMNITYDNIGNMTSFNGRTYSWLGRQLQSISGLATYTYNMDGQRIGKITANDDITYYYNGDILAGQKNGNTVTFFMYDENGDYIGFNYAGMNFYYIKNAQNDVIAIADSSGTVVTRYTYDSWGKLLSMTGNVIFGTVNPIRYRSYYYDNESGLYYLKSRYYNPEIGRFICADGLVDNRGLTTQNLFQYCGNNPVNMFDSSGKSFGAILIGGLVLGCLLILAGCSTESEDLPSSSTTAPSSPSSSPLPSTSDIPTDLSDEEKVLVATIAAEATVNSQGDPVSSAARQAMANVAINRVGSREWSEYTTVAEICQFTGFDGYGDENYQACMTYLNSRDGSNATYEAVIWDVMAAYDNDITGGAQLYYTPATMKPAGSRPNWDFDVLTEVTISGVDPYYEGRFYKYK